jgi:hypothetical protein
MKMMIVLAGSLLLSSAALAAAPAGKPPGAVSCIDPHQMGGSTAEGEDTILFHVGTKIYRNRLASACPGLSRLNSFGTLESEPWGGQLCRGDSIRVLDPREARVVGLAGAPRCRLGWFEPVPPARP